MRVGLVARGDMAYALDLANLLSEAGLSISLYLSYEHTVREVDNRDNPIEQLYALGMLSPKCLVRLIKPPRMRNPFSILTYFHLTRNIHSDGVEVVHIIAGPHEFWLGMLAWMLRSIPVVVTMIVPQPNIGGDIPHFLNRLINKILAFGSDVVIVNGKEQIDFVKNYYGVSSSRLAFIPLNTQRRVDCEECEEPGLILFFGAARLHKGLEYLVRAQPVISKEISFARILISAHGEELQRCKEMIRDWECFEIHEGFTPRIEVAGLFHRASLVVLPYLSASTSGVLMTAYSFGKPVVATKVGCLPEYVQDNVTGLLVAPANVEHLANAIIRLLTDQALRNQMKLNVTKWIDGRNKSIVDATIRAYEKAVAMH